MLTPNDLFAAIELASELLTGVSISAGPRAKQRGFADAIEDYFAEHVSVSLKEHFALDTLPPRSKRSLEDFSVQIENEIAWIDVKSKDVDGTFSMPNLISIQRLWKIFESPSESLFFLFVDYTVTDHALGTARIDRVLCIPADRMNPDLLHIQNLGLGQLQMRPDADSQDLMAPCSGPGLREALPEMAVNFHNHQIQKFQSEAATWMSRRQPESQ